MRVKLDLSPWTPTEVPQYLLDFYALSSLAKDYNHLVILEKLKEIKNSLLYDVKYCVYRELRHGATELFDVLGIKDYKIKMTRRFFNGNRAPNLKVMNAFLRKNPDILKTSAKAFIKCFEGDGFGGHCWADISETARKLEEDNFENIGNSIVLIDRVVDTCHNNGACLDKLYPGIWLFLDKKSLNKSPDWIIEKSDKRMRRAIWHHNREPRFTGINILC